MLTFGDDTVWTAAEDRYETMPYRRVGNSGLKLPALSLGSVSYTHLTLPTKA